MLKLHHLLEQEADELKRLLGAKAGVVGEQPSEVADNAARATCARLKRDIASRRLHEANVSTSEVCVGCVRLFLFCASSTNLDNGGDSHVTNIYIYMSTGTW